MNIRIASILLALLTGSVLSAENFTFDRELSGWTKNSPNVSFDPAEKMSGDGSLKLTDGGSVSKTFRLEPDVEYEVSVCIKAENVTGGQYQGVLLRLSDGRKRFAVTGDPKDIPRQGTFDWMKCTRSLKSSCFPGGEITVTPALTGKGTAWFDNITIVKKETAEGSASPMRSFHQAYGKTIRSAVLVPQGIFGFFEPGEAVKVKLLADGSAEAKYEYTLVVRDESGEVICMQERRPLEEEFELPGQPRGYYVLTSDLYADGEKAYTIQGGFAVSPAPGRRDPFFQFGFGALPELHDGYKRVGCGSIALKLNWRTAIPNGDVKKTADYLLNRSFKPFLESGDFYLVADLPTTLPRSVRSPEEQVQGMPLVNDRLIKVYLDFIAEIAPRIKVKEWAIGQETPSNATSEKYAGTWSEAMSNFVILTRLGSRLLKKIDPEIKIQAGGNNVPSKTATIEPIQMGDLVGSFDIYYIDAYTGQWDLAKVVGVMLPEVALMDFYKAASNLSVQLGKGKYISNNETGYSINYGAPFDRGLAPYQARLTARSLIISRAAPVLYYQLFRPNDYNQVPKDDFAMHMATVWKTVPMHGKYYRIPLPGGAMYATAASELAFAKFEKEIISGNVYSYIFTKPDGSTLVTLWNILKEQPFDLKLPADSTVLNMVGRDLTGKPLVIGPAPLYITIPGPAKPVISLVEHAVLANTPELKCLAAPDAVWVRSLTRRTLNATIRMPDREPIDVKILPGQTVRIPVKVSAPGKLLAGTREYDIPLENVPVCTALKVSDSARPAAGEPGILRVPDHVRPIEALQPERCFFRSEGFNPNGHDVSARYWLGYDDKNFYLTVEVDDPVHLQRHTGKYIWRDDCLQFVLSPKDYPPSALLSDAEARESSEYSFGLALTAKGPQLVKFLGDDAGIKDYPASVIRRDGITRYEVAVPWSAVGGRAKRFGFLVMDNNSPTFASAPYRLEFTAGIAGGADSSRLARLNYEEK